MKARRTDHNVFYWRAKFFTTTHSLGATAHLPTLGIEELDFSKKLRMLIKIKIFV